MEPTVFMLTGFPGTGKYTVAKALVDHLEAEGGEALLVDNHWVNNPILGLVGGDGITPLPPQVWDRVKEVRDAVFRTLEEITPRHFHVITTVFLDGRPGDLAYVERLEALASARDSHFVPVRLTCEMGENVRRISLPQRRERMKAVDPELPIRLAQQGPAFASGHPNELSMDVTELEPADAAGRILEHAVTVAPGH